jgi:hypothetical protein
MGFVIPRPFDFDLIQSGASSQRSPFWDGFDTAAGGVSSNPRYANVGTAGTFTANGTTGRTHWVAAAVTTTGGFSGLRTVASTFTPRSAENWQFKAIVLRSQAGVVDATGVIDLYAGFRANFTSGLQDGIYFRSTQTTSGTGNWFLVCRSGGSESTVDMGIAPSATPKLLEFRITGGGASVQGYVDGVLTGAAIATNIPSGLQNVTLLVNNRTANVTTGAIIEGLGIGWKGDLA